MQAVLKTGSFNRLPPKASDTAKDKSLVYDELKRISLEMEQCMGSEEATKLLTRIKANPHAFLPLGTGVCNVPQKQVRAAELYLTLQDTERVSTSGAAGETAHNARAAMYTRQIRFIMQRIYLCWDAPKWGAVRSSHTTIHFLNHAREFFNKEFADFVEAAKNKGVNITEKCIATTYQNIPLPPITTFHRMYQCVGDERMAVLIPGLYAECKAETLLELLAGLVEYEKALSTAVSGDPNAPFSFPPEYLQFSEV